ncbi:hypothetical protein AHAT_26180 [Agarivorans sp. Toyoura001]|uniref:hypothetical protein n=1 Tax=Agarivorans sp. Toyoura001 TaxID=2283141 RepID=UPI0010F25D1F|nr:hypothetical protein [Agarivorans sp. Toyoura001]GDY26728.1 hypothetical protein AHAT_26180 [Agarivorans sp. Toyoura001]
MSDLVGRTFSLKFPADVLNRIEAEMDKTGLTGNEVIRNATTSHLMQPSLIYLLKQFEVNMLRKNFEMNAIIVGLTKEQRLQAVEDCNVIFGKEVL